MTQARRSGGTWRSALANTGMLPNGSVIKSKSTVAEAKVVSMFSLLRKFGHNAPPPSPSRPSRSF